MNNRGFTLIELIIVVAVLAVFGTIGTLNLTTTLDRQRLEADEISVFQLNDATESYALVSGSSLDDTSDDFVFKDCSLDYNLMINRLMDNGFLVFSLEVESENAEFKWDTNAQEWILVIN